MAHTCASCRRQFHNNVSLTDTDQSALKDNKRYCRKQGTLPKLCGNEPALNHQRWVTMDQAIAINQKTLHLYARCIQAAPSISHITSKTMCPMAICHWLTYPPHAPTPPKHEDHYSSPTIEETVDVQPHPLQTVVNKLGVFRRYTHLLSWNPKTNKRLNLIHDLLSVDTVLPVNIEAIHKISPPAST